MQQKTAMTNEIRHRATRVGGQRFGHVVYVGTVMNYDVVPLSDTPVYIWFSK